jgi:signal transduction histidine kinase
MDQRNQPSRRDGRSNGRRGADAATLQLTRDDERARIARELHDDLGQLLATLRGDLSLFTRQPELSAAMQEPLRGMDQLLLAAIASLRRIANNLRPRALDDGSLYFALQAMCMDFARRHGMHCERDIVEAELCFDDQYSTAVFRIVQESLTNVGRHAQANHVCISVRRQDGMLRIRILDDGVGLSDSDLRKPGSLGLVGMRERVQALNGRMSIRGKGGARVTVLLPLPDGRVNA